MILPFSARPFRTNLKERIASVYIKLSVCVTSLQLKYVYMCIELYVTVCIVQQREYFVRNREGYLSLRHPAFGTPPALVRYTISFHQKQSGTSTLSSIQVQRLDGISFELLKPFISSACTEQITIFLKMEWEMDMQVKDEMFSCYQHFFFSTDFLCVWLCVCVCVCALCDLFSFERDSPSPSSINLYFLLLFYAFYGLLQLNRSIFSSPPPAGIHVFSLSC